MGKNSQVINNYSLTHFYYWKPIKKSDEKHYINTRINYEKNIHRHQLENE